MARELKEEIGFNEEFNPIITHYTDEIKQKDGKMVHNIEIDFIIDVNKEREQKSFLNCFYGEKKIDIKLNSLVTLKGFIDKVLYLWDNMSKIKK